MDRVGDILLVTRTYDNPITGTREIVTLHGIDIPTGRWVCLPSKSPHALGATFHAPSGEYVLYAS